MRHTQSAAPVPHRWPQRPAYPYIPNQSMSSSPCPHLPGALGIPLAMGPSSSAGPQRDLYLSPPCPVRGLHRQPGAITVQGALGSHQDSCHRDTTSSLPCCICYCTQYLSGGLRRRDVEGHGECWQHLEVRMQTPACPRPLTPLPWRLITLTMTVASLFQGWQVDSHVLALHKDPTECFIKRSFSNESSLLAIGRPRTVRTPVGGRLYSPDPSSLLNQRAPENTWL